MRRAHDLPRRPRPRFTARAALITIGLIFLGVVVFGRAIAAFYVDALWHDGLGRGDIFWGQIWAKLTLFVIFFVVFVVLAGLNLYAADRNAPTSFPANVHPYVERFHEVFGHRLRLVRYGTAVVLAFMLSIPAVSKWQEWLLYRNSQSFGVKDPQFGIDVGFYVFELPFISFAVDWLFAALVIVLLLTIVAHLLNGGVLFTSSAPSVRSGTKAHLAVLLAVLAVVKAADYWFARYELTNERRGFVQGATYTVVKAQLPALMLLVLVALLTAGLYLWTIRTNKWRLPVVASALWFVVVIVGGAIYPALVQSLIVKPNQGEREAPYIARNVEATRAAMGIGDVTTKDVQFERLTAVDVEANLEPLTNVRLLNPTVMLSRFRVDRGETAGLTIADLDVGRSEISGIREQTLVAARELDLRNIPNKSWQGQHLVSTRGCGLVSAPVNRVSASDRPIYSSLDLDRPELYFSPVMTGYAIAGTAVAESSCGDGGPYSGTAGVSVSGFGRRAAFALAFLDYNVIASSAIDSDSQMLWIRSVEERVNKLAPFLAYDGDPYPVVVDGAVQWVIDAYTSTSRYPYAQRVGDVQLSAGSGISPDANYIRNSVKAVIDAYTGDVTFFVMDDKDPVLRAWQSAFPKLFTPIDDMPRELIDNRRYPEDLFRVQTELYSKYQLSAGDFFQRRNAWSVAQEPPLEPQGISSSGGGIAGGTGALQTDLATESGASRFAPYYTLFANEDGREEFVLLRPFVPFSSNDDRTELQAYMTASSDPESYGQLTSYVVGNEPQIAGPLRVASQAESDRDISREITLQDNSESGSSVFFGNLQLVPVGDGMIYVRPFYVVVNAIAEFRFVIVSHNDRASMACDLSTALADLFPGFDANVGDRVNDSGDVVRAGECDDAVRLSRGDEPTTDQPDTSTDLTTDSDPVDVGDGASAAELLQEADRLFGVADGLLRDGDLGGYQTTVDQAGALVARALALLESGG